MGASLTWMACRSIDIKNIQKKLKVRKTFDKEKAEFFGVVTLEEQVFIWDCGVGISPVLNHDDLRRSISKGHEVYFCVAEEHVMFSEASLWVDGQEIWGVTHRGEEVINHLEERGNLPDCYYPIKEKWVKIQEKELEAEDEEDVADCIFNVPINLAQEFTKYDYNIGEPEGEKFYWKRVKPSLITIFAHKLLGK